MKTPAVTTVPAAKPGTHSPQAHPPAANPFAQVRFVLSAAQLHQLPDDARPEVAFVGRSNAGKSSALNVVCGIHRLARVSKTPGRTQLINLFELPERARLVDLPGYGFAQVPGAIREGWRGLVGGYLEQRPNLRGLIVLMDIRHPLTDIDRTMLTWSAAYGRPCHVLLTKSDKLGFGASRNALLALQRTLAAEFRGTTAQLFSALTPTGAEAAREQLAEWLDLRTGETDKKEPGGSG